VRQMYSHFLLTFTHLVILYFYTSRDTTVSGDGESWSGRSVTGQ